MNKSNRATYLQDTSKKRNRKRKSTITEDTLAMQERYVNQGYFNITEIAFLMANDSYNQLLADVSFGTDSPEYQKSFARANSAVKVALPYFGMTLNAGTLPVEDDDVSKVGVEEALQKMLDKRTP